jgi:hypothetical protein
LKKSSRKNFFGLQLDDELLGYSQIGEHDTPSATAKRKLLKKVS